jgi:hypothetical protein
MTRGSFQWHCHRQQWQWVALTMTTTAIAQSSNTGNQPPCSTPSITSHPQRVYLYLYPVSLAHTHTLSINGELNVYIERYCLEESTGCDSIRRKRTGETGRQIAREITKTTKERFTRENSYLNINCDFFQRIIDGDKSTNSGHEILS